MSQLEYAKLSQTDYNQEKFIPQTNPMQRPKEQPPIQQQYPTPAPFNTLLPSNTAQYVSCVAPLGETKRIPSRKPFPQP